MKRFLPTLILYVVLSSIFMPFVNSSGQALAATKGPVTPSSVQVQGTVGEYTLSISGYIAPNASISLTVDGVLLRGTVANAEGYFSLTAIKIKKDIQKFCLTAVDFRQFGDSYTCIDVPPGSGNINQQNIFLPPTFGLSRTEVNAGSVAIGRGYSMPGARVTLHLSNGTTLSTTADATGYYEISISGLSAGTYTMYADATFNNKQSLRPIRSKELKVLTLGEVSLNYFKQLWNWLLRLLTSLGLGPLWLVIPILILIIILLYKLHPEWFGWFDRFKPLKKLHHWWFVGY